MGFRRTITTVSVNAEGAHNEVITGGVIDVTGKSMFDKAVHLERHADDLRKFLLQEPRGKVIACTNLVLPSNEPGVDAGYIIMESAAYVPMSGTNTISTVTALLETGILPMTEPETRLRLETPGGIIEVIAECKSGKCVRVQFDNVPCFVVGLGYELDVPGIGKVDADVAYGGMFYAIVDAQSVGLRVEPKFARDLVAIGERIKAAASEQVQAVHPENAGIHTVNQTLFTEPLTRLEDGRLTARNTVVVSPGRLDRSPCGTGTSARLAVMYQRGEIGLNEDFLHESIIGTQFVGRIRSEVALAGTRGIAPSISGRGWITGFHTHVLDPSDPLPTGYRLNDTWPDELSQPATLGSKLNP